MSFFGELETRTRDFLYFLLRGILRNTEQSIPLDVSAIQKILVFRYDRMGDAIVTLPALRLLKEQTNAEIHVLCSKRNYSVFDDCSSVSQRFVVRDGLFGHVQTILQLRRERYDLILAFVFDRSTYAGLLANAIRRAAIKVGRLWPQRDAQYSVLFNVRLSLAGTSTEHATMAEGQQSMCARLLGVPSKSIQSQSALELRVERVEKARQLAASISKRPLVMVNVSAGAEERNLSKELSMGVITHILSTIAGADVLVFGIHRDRALVDEIVRCVGNRASALHTVEHILDVAALIQCMKLVITPDTSVLHLADSLRVPLVGCYLQEHPEWYPSVAPHRLVLCPRPSDFSSLRVSDIANAIDSLCQEVGPAI